MLKNMLKIWKQKQEFKETRHKSRVRTCKAVWYLETVKNDGKCNKKILPVMAML